jgi:TonB-dependent starch-binding outer membrane protein SusC
MKIRLKQLLKICMMLIFTGLSVSSIAQTSVSGVVTDSKDGTPVEGVTVSVKGTRTAVKTNATGAYSIKVPSSTSVLVFSSASFSSQQLIASSNVVNVKMVQSNTQLQDVVVVAYGTKKKGDLTGSVVSVSTKDFQKGIINSSEQLLQGKVAGLEVTTGGGAAGGGSKIRIRGGASLNASNDPLIVIDGVPVEGNGVAGSPNYLGTINPNDIESMSVLKDAASTVLYGSRASNGVILITTKKGTSGKTVYNFSTKYSLSRVEDFVKVLTGDQIRQIINEEAAATGSNTFKSKYGNASTDWQKVIYQQAQGFDNNLSASGTIKDKTTGIQIPFRASLGYLTQDGVLKTNNTKRLSSSLNLSPKFFDNHLSVNLAVKYSNQNTQFANEGAIGAAVAMNPTQPVYSGQKNWGGYYETLQANGVPFDLATRNPLALLELQKSFGVVDRTIGNVQLDYKLHFFPDLHIKANVGLDDAYGYTSNFADSTAAYAYQVKGSISTFSQSKKNRIADISLFYTKDLKNIKSKVDVLLLHSYQTFATKNFNSLSLNQNGGVIDGSRPTLETTKFENRIESYLGSINYSYNDKYLLTASIRRDATSKFAKDFRTGYFPAVAIAWKLKNEFFKNSNFVNDLKLRASYGETGQQDGVQAYGYSATYSPSSNSASYQFGNSFFTFQRPDAYISDLRWESTASTNLGIDFSLMNNRISGSVDVYQKKTKDLFSPVPVALGANFTNATSANVGNQINKGIEVAINLIPVRTKNIVWNFNVNGSYNEGNITNLLLNQVPGFKGVPVSGISGGTGNSIGRLLVNSPASIFFPSQQVYNASGKPIEGLYEDINRDGTYTEDDRFIFKKSAPDFLIGFNTQVSVYNFTVGLAAHAQIGNYLYNNFNSNNGSLTSIQNSLGFIGNASTNYLDTRFGKPQFLSNYYIENASFFRLDNINVGYNFGRVFKSNSTLSINGSIQNVLVVTKYSGADPENTGSVDNNIYPRPRIYSVGASINF